MINFTSAARQQLDHYLAELRRVLSDCGSVDAQEVESDVEDHIQAALSDAAVPVGTDALEHVLKTLGAPADWLQDQPTPWFRRTPRQWADEMSQAARAAMQQFAAGPESYRMPYVSLFTLLVVWGIATLAGGDKGFFFGIVGTLAAFIVARASLTLYESGRPSAGQMWLLTPSLAVVYVPLLLALLGGPIVAGTSVTVGILEHGYARLQRAEREEQTMRASVEAMQEQPEALAEAQRARQAAEAPLQWGRLTLTRWTLAALAAAGTAVWWLILGQIAWWKPGLVRALFRPFADNYHGRSGLVLSLFAVLVLAVAIGFIA